MFYAIEKRIIPGLSQRNLSASNIVVAHEAGNPNNTGIDSLEKEISFMTRNWRNAFVSHFVGSGGRIVQLAYPGKMQYGAGTVANKYGYAHVELARTKDPEIFKKDYAAYVWLLRKLADDAGIPKTLDTNSTKGIKSHDWVRRNMGGTTHTDPYGYFKSFGITKAQFKKDIEPGTSNGVYVPPKKQTGSATTKNMSVVDYMKSKNMDASYSNRAKLANEYGIKNYSGTATQNVELLNKLKAGKPSEPKKTKSSTYKGNSIVDYLNSIDESTSFSHRRELAKKHGFKNYTGTAAQNLQLLNKLRGGGSRSKPKGDMKTNSIVDYLKSIDVNSSFANRKKLAAKHGIKNYSGTAVQNAQLLKKMRG